MTRASQTHGEQDLPAAIIDADNIIADIKARFIDATQEEAEALAAMAMVQSPAYTEDSAGNMVPCEPPIDVLLPHVKAAGTKAWLHMVLTSPMTNDQFLLVRHLTLAALGISLFGVLSATRH